MTQRGCVEGLVALDQALVVLLKGPLALVVLLLGRIEAGEQAVLEGILLAHQEGSVGVVQYVVGEVFLVVQDVFGHAAHEGDVRTGAQGHVEGAAGRGAGEFGVHVDDHGALFLGLDHPAEGDGMVFGTVAADDEHRVGIADIGVMIGHSAASNRLCQSRYGGAVSDPGLVV